MWTPRSSLGGLGALVKVYNPTAARYSTAKTYNPTAARYPVIPGYTPPPVSAIPVMKSGASVVPISFRPASRLPGAYSAPAPVSSSSSSAPATTTTPGNPASAVETAPAPSYGSDPVYSSDSYASGGGGGSYASDSVEAEPLTPEAQGAAVAAKASSNKMLVIGVAAIVAFVAYKKFKG